MPDQELRIVLKAQNDGSAVVDKFVGDSVGGLEKIERANSRVAKSMSEAGRAAKSSESQSIFAQAGKAGKNEEVAKIGEIFEKTEGLDGSAGILAKVLGAGLIVDKLSEKIGGFADKVHEVDEVLRSSGKPISDFALFQPSKVGELARTIPVVGELAGSFDKLKDSIVSAWTGKETIDEIKAAGERIDKTIADATRDRNVTIEVIQKYYDELSPTMAINRDRDKKLAETKKKQDDGKLHDGEYADAVEAINADADQAIAAAQKTIGAFADTITRSSLDAYGRIEVSQLRDAGDIVAAQLKEIDNAAQSKIEQIKRQIDEVNADKLLMDDVKASRVSALNGLMETTAIERDRATQKVRVDAPRQQQADVAKITLDSLRAQADLGDRAAKIEADKLDLAQKYAGEIDDINTKLGNTLLSPELRKRLEDLKAALPDQAAAALAMVGESAIDARVRPEDRVATAVDGRFNPESLIARSQSPTTGEGAIVSTAASAKVTADAQREIVNLLGIIAGKPAVAGVNSVTSTTIDRHTISREIVGNVRAAGVDVGGITIRATDAITAAVLAAIPKTKVSNFGQVDRSRDGDRGENGIDLRRVPTPNETSRSEPNGQGSGQQRLDGPAILAQMKATADASKAAADSAAKNTQATQDLLRYFQMREAGQMIGPLS